MKIKDSNKKHYDVIAVGAGMAGLYPLMMSAALGIGIATLAPVVTSKALIIPTALILN